MMSTQNTSNKWQQEQWQVPASLVTARNSLELQKREETGKKRGKKRGKIRIRLFNNIYPKKVSLEGHIGGLVGLKLLLECVQCLFKEKLKKWEKNRKNWNKWAFRGACSDPAW